MRAARIKRVRDILEACGLTAVFLTDPANVFYFSGFSGTPGDASLLITRDALWILTDGRYTLQALEQCPDYKILGKNALDVDALTPLINHNGACVGFENESVSYRLWKRAVSQNDCAKWIPLGSQISDIRQYKDQKEIACIKRACEIACEALSETLPYIRPGNTEQDIKAELEYRMMKKGASAPSFDTIVASGIRSALPHGQASDKVICYGESVTVDFGAVYQGYCSDMTRTFFIGEAKNELHIIYETVRRAQEAALDAFYPGIPSCELDAVSRRMIAEAGYGKYFTHALGHGVGVEIHEGVSVNSRNQMPLTTGMVFSVEPGIYVEGVGGVRIEDLVYCTEDGLQILTKGFKKDLAIL